MAPSFRVSWALAVKNGEISLEYGKSIEFYKLKTMSYFYKPGISLHLDLTLIHTFHHIQLCTMPRSRKNKFRRLEHKYRSFVFRSLAAFLLVACLLFFLGIAYSTDGTEIGVNASTSPFLHFGFIWLGIIFIILCVKFVLSTLRAHAEKRLGHLFGQLSCALMFLLAGLSTVLFGIRVYLI